MKVKIFKLRKGETREVLVITPPPKPKTIIHRWANPHSCYFKAKEEGE